MRRVFNAGIPGDTTRELLARFQRDVAMRAPDRFAQLTAIGISSKIALQVLLNIAVVTNSLPNTGISLPFFSYGGTAMVVQLIEVGTLLAISRYTVEKK